MAQSARTAALLAQRKNSVSSIYGGSGKIRLLSPTNSSVNTISRQAVTSELNVKISAYNAGQLSNSDMLDFLNKMNGNGALSATDKLDVQNQIRDFQDKVQNDKLQAVYNAAPDNSMQKLQAAQSIAQYYKDRASGMVADTPAYSQAMQNAGTWDNQVISMQDTIQKQARTNQRYVLEQKVNQIPSGTSENATQKAEMWKTLYDQAVADGDTTAANQYAANYQQELTNADTISTKETDKANKTQLSDYINSTINDYHDGKISGDEALSALEQADQFAYNIGDTAAQNRLNGLSITINREIDKGITYSNVNGLSQKSGSGSGSGTSDVYLNPDGSLSMGGGGSTSTGRTTSIGTTITPTGTTGGKTTSSGNKVSSGTTIGGSGSAPKTLDQLDFEYKSDITTLDKALQTGQIEIDGQMVPFSPNAYKVQILLLSKNRQLQLTNVTEGLNQVVNSNGASSKVGKKAVALLNQYQPELQQVTIAYQGLASGNLVFSMGIKSDGAVELKVVPKGSLNTNAVDVKGVYYTPRTEGITFETQQDAINYAKAQKLDAKTAVGMDPNGKFYVNDANGKQLTRNVLDIYDTSGNKISYEYDQKYGYMPMAVGPITAKLRGQMKAEADKAMEMGNIWKPNLMNYNDVLSFDKGAQKAPFGTTTPKVKDPTLTDQVVGAVGGAINSVVAPKVPVPKEPIPSASGVVLPSSPPMAVKPQSNPTDLSVAGNVKINPVQTMAQNTPNFTPVKISAPTPVTQPTPVKTAQQLNLPANLPLNPSKPVDKTPAKPWWQFW